MKAGEYKDVNGRLHRWTRADGDEAGWFTQRQLLDGMWVVDYGFSSEDWPAAKAALDELIEAEAGEWVELADGGIRIRKDSSDPQWLDPGRDWQRCSERDHIAVAYRKGLAVVLAQAWELANEVLDVCVNTGFTYPVDESPAVVMRYEDYSALCALARKVRL
jgi:hypothetical protein